MDCQLGHIPHWRFVLIVGISVDMIALFSH